jgi:hypothetical protein
MRRVKGGEGQVRLRKQHGRVRCIVDGEALPYLLALLKIAFYIRIIFVVLGIKSKALHVLVEGSATGPHLHPHY